MDRQMRPEAAQEAKGHGIGTWVNVRVDVIADKVVVATQINLHDLSRRHKNGYVNRVWIYTTTASPSLCDSSSYIGQSTTYLGGQGCGSRRQARVLCPLLNVETGLPICGTLLLEAQHASRSFSSLLLLVLVLVLVLVVVVFLSSLCPFFGYGACFPVLTRLPSRLIWRQSC